MKQAGCLLPRSQLGATLVLALLNSRMLSKNSVTGFPSDAVEQQ
jgi:hypothetical protein